MIIIIFLIILTFLVTFLVTPAVINISKKKGLVDIPNDKRRVHETPTPRIGGIAIAISMTIGFLFYYILTKNTQTISFKHIFLGYALGAIVIFIMGLVDDIYNLRARQKFVFQLIAAIILCIFGITIDTAKIPFIYTETFDLGIFSIPLTMIWVIGITNAVNLIDGLDGLAAGIASISALALLIIFVTTSSSLEAIIITSVLLGSVLGFIPYNFNPAKIFMGDTGSNLLGYTLATVSILGLAKGYTIVAIVSPILILGVPIFDTLFAMVRRFLAGRPLLSPDGGHIHHRLLKKGFSQKQAVLILYIITSILSIIAVTIISPDIYKLILLILATICFFILGYITTIKKHKNDKKE